VALKALEDARAGVLRRQAVGAGNLHASQQRMRLLAWTLTVLLLLLQHRLWLSEDGLRPVRRLEQQLLATRAENERLTERNLQLLAQVRGLAEAAQLEVPVREEPQARALAPLADDSTRAPTTDGSAAQR
jgi:cell division protein FtsB